MAAGREGADRGGDPPGVAYVYAPDRKAVRPIAHLAGFTGILQVDGYSGYRVAGSDAGAEHWAVIASLIETCKLNGVEPLGYIADVLTRIVNGHLNRRIDDLLPWAYITAPELKAVA